MKDVTSTSFGLLIAFVLPGFTGLLGLQFVLPSVKRVLETFLTAQSNIGLFFLVVAGAISIGLQLALLRWLVFEKLLCKSERLEETDFQALGSDGKKLDAFRTVAEEHYRYHQFWGGMSIAMPFLVVVWLIHAWPTLDCLHKCIFISGPLIAEVITVCGAVAAFGNYVRRGKAILKGG
jgi:hypothetical protein